jgi:hypothetical protein
MTGKEIMQTVGLPLKNAIAIPTKNKMNPMTINSLPVILAVFVCS